jgi:hypothetical protein
MLSAFDCVFVTRRARTDATPGGGALPIGEGAELMNETLGAAPAKMPSREFKEPTMAKRVLRAIAESRNSEIAAARSGKWPSNRPPCETFEELKVVEGNYASFNQDASALLLHLRRGRPRRFVCCIRNGASGGFVSLRILHT